MKNRAEAVEYLRQHGYAARERDWALGETILIPVGKGTKVGTTGLVKYRDVMYLYPVDDGWAIWVGCLMTSDGDPHYSSLADAVVAAMSIDANYDEWCEQETKKRLTIR